MAIQWEQDMIGLLGEKGFILDEDTRNKLSKDYYWYSPVLDKQLKEKMADGIAVPDNEEEMIQVLSLAYRHRIPVTVRGAGTGNYGQAVPLNGGIVLDLSRLNRILEIGDGFARVQCGVKLGALEKELRDANQELCIYPTTYAKATVGGFVCGGSGGIGSITWGNLWDGNVLGAVVYSMEETPKRMEVSGEELLNYIHGYGTTGVLTELTMRTAPKTDWIQSIVQFAGFDSALLFTEKIAKDPTIRKRLVSCTEWPIPSYFLPLLKHIESDQAAVLLETEDGSLPAINELARIFGGKVNHVIPAEKYHKIMGLSDFTWNHTTLWALKSDASVTYLQSGFSPEGYLEQAHQIKNAFGDEVMFHFEWILNGGNLTPTALPIVRYTTQERLYEIIGYFESVGAQIFNPHTWLLEDGGRGDVESMIEQKKLNDPLGLLNPGKINFQSQHPVRKE